MAPLEPPGYAYGLKCKRQRRDICEKFTVWNFATKRATVKFMKPWMSSHFSSASKNPSYVGPCVQNGPRKIDEARPAGYTHGKVVQRTRWHDYIPTLLGSVLVWSQQNYLRLLLTVRYFKSSWGCYSRDTPQRKIRYETEWINVVNLLQTLRFCSL